jgi:hypothetical protein
MLVCVLLSALIGLALIIGTASLRPTPVASPQAASPDKGFSTGSMVFMPAQGNRCRKRIIDNATWRIQDGGEVDCATALAPKGNPGARWPTSRVDVIRESFRRQ